MTEILAVSHSKFAVILHLKSRLFTLAISFCNWPCMHPHAPKIPEASDLLRVRIYHFLHNGAKFFKCQSRYCAIFKSRTKQKMDDAIPDCCTSFVSEDETHFKIKNLVPVMKSSMMKPLQAMKSLLLLIS